MTGGSERQSVALHVIYCLSDEVGHQSILNFFCVMHRRRQQDPISSLSSSSPPISDGRQDCEIPRRKAWLWVGPGRDHDPEEDDNVPGRWLLVQVLVCLEMLGSGR